MKKKILEAYETCMRKDNELSAALQVLGGLVSKTLGTDYVAEMCHGGEIEFRTTDEFGYVDPYCCVRLEQILEKIK